MRLIKKDSLVYSPETGEVWRWVGNRMKPLVGKDNQGYITVRFKGKMSRAHRLAWYLVYGVWPNVIDHINGDPADNRICNLRNTTQANNLRNIHRTNGASGVVGVNWCKDRDAWHVCIQYEGKRRQQRVPDLLSAVALRIRWERELNYLGAFHD